CRYEKIPAGFQMQIKKITKGNTRKLSGDLNILLASFGVKTEAEVINFADGKTYPLTFRSVWFDRTNDNNGCDGPSEFHFDTVSQDKSTGRIFQGIIRPDWLVLVEDMAKQYPAAWKLWRKQIPAIIKEVEADGGFRSDILPEMRKADENKIAHPALIYKD